MRFLDLILRVNDRKLKGKLRSSERDIKSWGQRTSKTLKTAFAAGVGGFAGFASIQGIGSLGKEVLATEEKLTRIGIQAGYSADELEKLRKSASDTGREFGLSRAQVLDAADQIVSLEGASGLTTAKMRVLAQASVATGANMRDLAGIAFAMNKAFVVDNADDLLGTLSAVTAAGKEGSVPLTEMSTLLQQVAIDFKKVSFAGKAGAADLAAAIQIARGSGFGSASEAGTGLTEFVNQLEAVQPKLQSFGVQVFRAGKDGRKELRPIRDILDGIGKSRLIKDPWLMSEVFGSATARKFLNALLENEQAFEDLATSAKQANDIQADSQKFLSSSAGRLKIAIANARAELEALITPERIERFVTVVERQLVPAFEFVLDNAKEIAIVLASIKVASLVRSTWQWGHAMSGLVTKAGGMGAVLGNAQTAVLGSLGGFLKFAGPIGLAATAAWGLYKAIKSSRQESSRLTEEQIKQAELAGKVVGKVSQYDPQGRVDARKKEAAFLQNRVVESNKALYDPMFAKNVDFNRRRAGAMMNDGEVEELLGLRQKFQEQRGNLDDKDFQRLQELMKAALLLEKDQELLAGSRGVKAQANASRLIAEAQAINEVERLRFGNPDFQIKGMNLQQLAAERGLEGDDAKTFIASFMKEAGEAGASERTTSRFTANAQGLGVRRRGLGVNADGVVAEMDEYSGILGVQGASALVDTITAGWRSAEERLAAARGQELADALASAQMAQLVEGAMSNALMRLDATALGTAIGVAIANTSPRSPV